jgi:biopolymer transport protein ExbD
MKFRDDSEEEVQINLTPLIDVVFLLLIFFMVSTTFSKESQLRIKLPEASATAQPQEKKTLDIDISAKGLYAVKGPDDKTAQALLKEDPADLLRAIKLAAGGRADLTIVIRADRMTPHEAVIRAMDASQRLGYTHITFATQQAAPDSERP